MCTLVLEVMVKALPLDEEWPEWELGLLNAFLPTWLHFVVGTDDMKFAYRQHPVAPVHHCITVVAVWDMSVQAIRFIMLFGMPYELSSAVLNFVGRPPYTLPLCAVRLPVCPRLSLTTVAL